MQLTIQGKQMDVGDALRTHASDKLEEINRKYFNHATDGTVIFAKEGHGHGVIRVNIQIRVGRNITVTAEGEAGDAHGAFDKAADKIAKQLRRYKTRLRDHHDKMQAAERDILHARENVLADEPEDEELGADHAAPAVIAEMTTPILTMSVSEAVMRLDLGGQAALLFHNASHGGLNMVYRRSDGNVGWVDPAEAQQLSARKSA
jgi:ribosomal subunit interface protein